MERSECVVKIKFGNILHKVTYKYSNVWNGRYASAMSWRPDLTFETLQSQICKFFELPSTARFSITYTDAENDVVTISYSDDLKEVITKQSPGISLRMEVTLLSSRDRILCGISNSNQISSLHTREAVKQLMTKLISAFESTKLQIQAYETLLEETNSAAQIPTLVDNLLQIIMVWSELTLKLTSA